MVCGFGIVTSVNVPGSFLLALVGLVLLAIFVLTGWGVRLLASIISNRRFPTQARWLIVPAIFGVTALLAVTTAENDLVLRVARPWIERDARSMMSSKTTPNKGWLGPLPVTAVSRTGGTLFFEVAGTGGFFDSAGYAWSSSTPPQDGVHPLSSHVTGAWWKWEDTYTMGD